MPHFPPPLSGGGGARLYAKTEQKDRQTHSTRYRDRPLEWTLSNKVSARGDFPAAMADQVPCARHYPPDI